MIKILPLIFCLGSVVLADDFRTSDGKEYKDVTVRRVEPDGIVVATKGGVSKLYFAELPPEVRQRFVGSYGSEQELRTRYMQLQLQEQVLLQQIGQANIKKHKHPTGQLPVLRKQLDDVHAGMKDVKSQLDALDLLRARRAVPYNDSH